MATMRYPRDQDGHVMVPIPRQFGTVAVDKGPGKIYGPIRSIERRQTFRGRMDRYE
jgi:hypothetical protein